MCVVIAVGGPTTVPLFVTRRADIGPGSSSGWVSRTTPLGPPAIRGLCEPGTSVVRHCDASLTLPVPFHSRT